MKHFTWSTRNSAIWEVANKLQENAIQVDVYLHAAVEESYNASGHKHFTTPRFSARRKKSQKKSFSFPAHKLILAAASPFLRKMLSEHYSEHRDACVDITIPNVLPETLHCILNFLYCGSADVPSDIKESVLEVACLLQIKDLTDYFQSNVKLEGYSEQENTLNENLIEPQSRARKRKKSSVEQNVYSHISTGAVQVKEEAATEQDNGGGGGVKIGRRRRKVKSKYSAEIYEIDLPKIRKWKRRKLQGFLKTEKETAVQCLAKGRQFEVSQELQKETVPSTTITIPHTHVKNSGDKLTKNEIIKDPFSLPPPSSPHTVYTPFSDKENKTSTLQLPLTLASASPSSVIIPGIFVPNQSYLPESTTKPEALAIVEEECGALSEKPQHPPAIPNDSPPLLSEVKELPLMSPHSSLASFPLKQLTSFTHDHKISEPLNEDKNEGEEQDGLFKFQVLLKDCEDFPDNVCGVPQSSQGSRRDTSEEKYQVGESNDDINTWISEEIHNCIIPTTTECDKESSQCEISIEDGKKEASENHVTAETNTSNPTVDKIQSEVECEHCGKKFSDHRSCQSHIRGVHNEARQMCKYCGKMFRRRCDLYIHERRHRTASLPCKFCGKIFKVAKDLQAHLTTHVGGKRFHCNYCNKELTSYRNLRNHIASIHQKERPFTCDKCNKTYSKACSLQVHMRSVHTGERPFKCSVCDKTFCNAALLKNHQVVHTGEKKYSCKVCGRPFSQYSNMISHQRIHTNHRPFLCLICHEGFKTKEGLLKHKWVHTGLKPLRCHHCHREFRIKDRFERHMLRFHNEVINIPEIVFELRDEIVADKEEEDTRSLYCNIKVIGTTGEEGHFQDGSHDQILDGFTDEGVADDLSPVVHLVSNMAEQEVGNGESGHVQLSYPLLTSATGLEEGSSITLGNIAGPISCSEPVDSVDVESLLNTENTPSGEALMESGREGKPLFIFAEMPEGTDGMREEINSQSSIKIWLANERGELQQRDEGDSKGDLLISNNTFGETSQAEQVLDTEINPEGVHSLILEGSESSM